MSNENGGQAQGAQRQAQGKERRPLLMLIDGHALVHRGYHAIAQRGQHLIARKTGEDTTAVFGFVGILLKALEDWKPTHMAIAFDTSVPTFRHQQFEAYKAQRPSTPDELRQAFPRVHQLMEALNVPIYEVDGYEADDVLGALCAQATEQGVETMVLTGDTDTLQLIGPQVKVGLFYRIQDRKVYDEAEVAARYGGLTPRQLIDFKALKGDPSDNIPGVPGIGEQTAIKLLQEFGSVEGIYEHLDQVKPERIRAALEAHREQVLLGKELTTITTNVPVRLDLEAARFGRFDRGRVLDLFRELEFFSLVNRVPQPTEAPAGVAPGRGPRAGQLSLLPSEDQAPPPEKLETSYATVHTQQELEALVQALRRARGFAFDTESTDMDPMRADLVGLSFATAPGKAWYVPLAHDGAAQLPLERVLAALQPLLEAPGVPKTAHNANYDMMMLANYGVRVEGVEFDTMLAAHLLGRKALGLKALALDVLNEEMTPISALIGTGRKQISMAQVPVEEAARYACADADMTWRLRERLEEELRREGLWGHFTEVDMPLVPVLVAMQRAGMKVDVVVLRELASRLNEQLARVEREVYDLAGHEFNLNSPKQLGDVLFDELKLPRTRRTRTGGYTTDAAALEDLKDAHPIVDKLLEYRQLAKLKSTYVDALPQMVNPRTGRVHTTFNQAGASSGRLASSDPNLMNIPVRTDLGRAIRTAFVAELPGWVLLSADYSQIELRVLAHLSRDEFLVAAFLNGEDIHRATASLMFNVPMAQVTPDQRRIAKVLNFGVIYGLSAYGIAQQTEFTTEEGARFIETYFAKYPGVKRWIEATREQVRTHGYVETLLGRRRYLPEIHSSNYATRSAAERMAINHPVQGTAAEIMSLAMVRIHRRMQEARMRAMMTLQVHDELIFEAPEEEVGALTALVQEEMPRALELVVPLRVDVKVGRSWGDME